MEAENAKLKAEKYELQLKCAKMEIEADELKLKIKKLELQAMVSLGETSKLTTENAALRETSSETQRELRAEIATLNLMIAEMRARELSATDSGNADIVKQVNVVESGAESNVFRNFPTESVTHNHPETSGSAAAHQQPGRIDDVEIFEIHDWNSNQNVYELMELDKTPPSADASESVETRPANVNTNEGPSTSRDFALFSPFPPSTSEVQTIDTGDRDQPGASTSAQIYEGRPDSYEREALTPTTIGDDEMFDVGYWDEAEPSNSEVIAKESSPATELLTTECAPSTSALRIETPFNVHLDSCLRASTSRRLQDCNLSSSLSESSDSSSSFSAAPTPFKRVQTYECTTCNQFVPSFTVLSRLAHIAREHTEIRLKCVKCSASVRADRFQDHLLTRHESTSEELSESEFDRLYQEQICSTAMRELEDEFFPSAGRVTQSGRRVNSVTCKVCAKEVKAERMQHVARHEKLRFECPIEGCSKMIFNSTHLKEHDIGVLSLGDRQRNRYENALVAWRTKVRRKFEKYFV